MEFLKYSILLLMVLIVTGCPDEDTSVGKDVAYSAVIIKPPFIEGKDLIALIEPANGEKVENVKDSNIDLRFKVFDFTHTSLILFNEKPEINSGMVTNYTDICIGGTASFVNATDLAGNILSLGNQTGHDVLYACGNDQVNFLDTSKTIEVNEKLLPPGMTVYWMVLSYNEGFALTHSSAISKFEIGL